ncbi:hypothetical protein BAX94_09315 [Elizabethkingia meningoseptica]|uniref:DUF304 domain-containing protein n=1 Tax=Elizabethkingia meningoseptica TaxID=238 RepID=A0A1T3F4C5_ELIME|nr:MULTISPECIES: hypothetical protein [Elizabethkingia]AQX11385.1 hypothetical protein BBD35_02860 [Elizabethkingia meningoseptica]MBG0512732.1 hypothetical protein [Elizabethkingia meningoseptica]MCL1673958.1 hypothetical protein [Elizabethkingia meningoseptica]MCL1685401.1 hypothetical protein [Elizabethkingia meningoseptica]MDE5432125.1 hypothetical protein [Elizabethkingia meningoseptica]
MKRIYFNNALSIFNITSIILGVTAVIGLNFVKDISYEQLYWYKMAAYCFIIVVFGKTIVQNVFLKNFVGWNSKTFQIKINTRKNTLIYFDQISKYSLTHKILNIDTPNQKYSFDLNNYRERDVQKILWILKKYAKV